MNHRHVTANGIRLHVAECGEGAPVVLLHGFPACWSTWKHQLPALAAAGYHAIAPDLRGYNLSEAPPRVRDYRARELVADVADLIRQCDGRCHLVGHDWGGAIAWLVAARHPELVEKLVVLNAPPVPRFAQVMRRDPRQWLRSWYTLFFQLPGTPERMLSARDFAALERGWRKEPFHANAFTDEDIAVFKTALRQQGLRGPINYYRAAMRYSRDIFGGNQSISASTLLIWGERDPYLGVSLTTGLERWAPNLRVERIADSGHWLQHEVPAVVNRLLVEFLS
jgi:pimeloyl-ACP methyl ester carboxylesterase